MSDTSWAVGRSPAAVLAAVRELELTINRRVDGTLHGDYQGITPGHGSEPGESRVYQPGDDVRRIDWNVTARTGEPHVRELIADRDLEAWLVIDTSAAMRFGTAAAEKQQIAIAAAACVGFLTVRNRNPVGAVLVAGPHLKVIAPRVGADQVRAIITSASTAPATDGLGPGDLAGALDRVAHLSRRRGFVTVCSDYAGNSWADGLARLGMTQDLLAIVVADQRERDLPTVGLVELIDPSTDRRREVRITAEVRRRFAEAAASAREERLQRLRRAGADVLELDTAVDWLTVVIAHVRHRRTQVVNAQRMAKP